MKKLMFFIVLLVSHDLSAQTVDQGCAKILNSSADVFNTDCDVNISRVGVNIVKDKISIRYKNGKDVLISKDSVWGFRRKNGLPSRIIKGEIYELYASSPVFIYRQYVYRSTRRFFSVGLDSPIYPLTEENIKKYASVGTYDEILNNKRISRQVN